MRSRVLGAVAVVVAAGALARADDRPLDRAELDKRVVRAVYETAVLGTDIFNKGNHEGCFRLYQGTLLAVQPMLDHRPKLQASVRDHLDRARTLKPAEGAFELRAALDEIQNDIAPNPKGQPPKTTALWDRLGGEKGVRAVIHDVLLAAIEDKKVNLTRDGKYKLDAKKVEDSIVDWVSEKTGGPLKYTGKNMKEAHAGMKITEEQFNELGGILAKSLEKFKVSPADALELMTIVAATKKDIVEAKGGN